MKLDDDSVCPTNEASDAVTAADLTRRRAAEEAIRDCGTNAIPTLLALCGLEDSGLRGEELELLPYQFRLRHGLLKDFEWRWRAVEAFGVLGWSARDATPRLEELLTNEDAEIRSSSARAIGAIGPGAGSAASALIGRIYDRDEGVQAVARLALGTIQGPPEVVVPALVETLDPARRTNMSYISSIVALGNLGPQAKAAIPALRLLLADTNFGDAAFVTSAIEQIDGDKSPR